MRSTYYQQNVIIFFLTDLVFYLEVQKYKELTHHYNDEELVKRKCQAIVDCFLESAIQPSCQVWPQIIPYSLLRYIVMLDLKTN